MEIREEFLQDIKASEILKQASNITRQLRARKISANEDKTYCYCNPEMNVFEIMSTH